MKSASGNGNIATKTSPDIEQAIARMLDQYRDNPWMLNEHWPLNEPHVRLMVADVLQRFPGSSQVRLLDVGCFNGYISYLFNQLGYQVTGTDADDMDDRQVIFNTAGIEFIYSNLNDLYPFKMMASNSFDVVIIAQVIEHILNHPLGLIKEIARVMRPAGLLILTTPNPVTIMGAVRVLKGNSMLWGTADFMNEPKIQENRIITKGDIHYREYTRPELYHLLNTAELSVEHSRYLGLGVTLRQSGFKRLLKKNPLVQRLMSRRLFGSNHYLLARKP
jgi:2-polyprenyl-3-methyl-5-hydroxy-6-metoxy-1,4-benzoquinol methylase